MFSSIRKIIFGLKTSRKCEYNRTNTWSARRTVEWLARCCIYRVSASALSIMTRHSKWVRLTTSGEVLKKKKLVYCYPAAQVDITASAWGVRDVSKTCFLGRYQTTFNHHWRCSSCENHGFQPWYFVVICTHLWCQEIMLSG